MVIIKGHTYSLNGGKVLVKGIETEKNANKSRTIVLFKPIDSGSTKPVRMAYDLFVKLLDVIETVEETR